jgi:hypothetical protein
MHVFYFHHFSHERHGLTAQFTQWVRKSASYVLFGSPPGVLPHAGSNGSKLVMTTIILHGRHQTLPTLPKLSPSSRVVVLIVVTQLSWRQHP